MDKSQQFRREVRSFVLRAGRFTSGQKHAYERFKNRYIISSAMDFQEILLEYKNNIVFELGFGMGEATWRMAKGNPANFYLCAEAHRPGIGRLMMKCAEEDINNIRIFEGDGTLFLNDRLSDASLFGIHIFFPDPWPKKKHHKRRLINPSFLELIGKKSVDGGYLFVATDWEEYGVEILRLIDASSEWEIADAASLDIFPERPQTAFERKGLRKGHVIMEIRARRRNTQ